MDRWVAAVWHNGLRKLPLLEEDLEFLTAHLPHAATEAVEAALKTA